MYKRILVTHLGAGSLKLPLTLPGVPPCGLVTWPPRLIAGLWQELLERWLQLAGDHRGQWDFAAGLWAAPALLWYSSHTKRRKMQRGNRAAQAWKRQTRLKRGGRQERGKVEEWRHWVEIKDRRCVSLFGLSWDPIAPPNPNPTILCDFSLSSYSSHMHAFVLPNARSRGKQWDSCTVGSL